MSKEIKLTAGYDPDKYRDDLCEASWRRSGAKTPEEHLNFIIEEAHQFALKRQIERDTILKREKSRKHLYGE